MKIRIVEWSGRSTIKTIWIRNKRFAKSQSERELSVNPHWTIILIPFHSQHLLSKCEFLKKFFVRFQTILLACPFVSVSLINFPKKIVKDQGHTYTMMSR